MIKKEEDVEITTHKKGYISLKKRQQIKLLKNEGQYLKGMNKLRYISPEERQKIIDQVRLV